MIAKGQPGKSGSISESRTSPQKREPVVCWGFRVVMCLGELGKNDGMTPPDPSLYGTLNPTYGQWEPLVGDPMGIRSLARSCVATR